ncbi:MAG: DUF3368 domain-containing protein [Anaerolineae bacterium]
MLHALYAEVLIPPAVYAEIMTGGLERAGVTELQLATWIRMKPLQDARRADLLVDLDRGEAEAITLTLELDADLLLVDERLVRRHAQRLGLTITGTLGILLKAKERGLVAELRPLIQQLRDNRIRLSEDVIRKALLLAKEV